YAKQPFAGPAQVLAYLARYTHRVAIGNGRLVELTDERVSFRWKDYRANGRSKGKVMTLAAGEFMRRFLMHVLPDGFHRIRHYGLFANGRRVENLALCRERLDVSMRSTVPGGIGKGDQSKAPVEPPPCPCCGGRMRIIETFDSAYSRCRAEQGFDSS
ncbi:MAG: transposase, partial [Rudaea sp.]|nr:transposase [Rudaea sp.]